MPLLESLERVHSTAMVDHVNGLRSLFSVEYPGLTLYVSIQTLVGFRTGGKGYGYINKDLTNTSKKHVDYLVKNWFIDDVYGSKLELQMKLKEVLDKQPKGI